MLKLRKVELIGFKSFCERTHIAFSGSGLTCIIGPNGCGKSNIVDAISWVLGEQSHKSLRAERMSDCIFNGTAKRPPLGLAEVTLTLVDPDLAEAARLVLEGAESSAAQAEEAEQVGEGPAASPADADFSPESSPEPSDDAAEDSSADAEQGSAPVKFLKKKRAAEKPAMHLKPGEVVIGRRLYRSGQSEYLLNGRPARLRDIQELFMGIGLGPDTYAIIEQGRIGQILSTKPSDRRAIIEEAAGITKFKTKRRLAEAKLESSKINLSRVNDILVEVEKQLGSLKRQASKARRYAEIREQMRGMLRQVFASKARELDHEAERIEGILRDLAASEAQLGEMVTQLESEHERLSARIYELDGELRQNQNLIGQASLELDRSENRIVFNRQRGDELEARSRQFTADLEQLAAQAAQLESRARDHQLAQEAIVAETSQLELVVQSIADEAAGLESRSASTETRIQELRDATSRLTEDLTRLHGEQAQAEQALVHHLEAVGRGEQREHQLLEESLVHRERAHAADLNWRTSVERAQGLESAVRETQSLISELRGRQQDASAQVNQSRANLADVRARRSTLDQILNDRSYTAEAVQKLFAAQGSSADRGFRAVGVLADYAEVEEQYEAAVEQFLREELEYVVVETFDVARAGISLLRDEVGGCATFFVDSLRTLKLDPDEPIVPFEIERDVVSRLDKLVDFRDPLGPAAKKFLPRLRAAYLVETAALAERLARENPACHFVTLDGTCYQGRMVTGGRPAEAGPLVMKRELRSLDVEVLRLERALGETQEALQQIEREIAEGEQALVIASAEHLEAQKAAVAATHRREQALGELARLGMDLADCQAELARVREQAQAARRKAEAASQDHSHASGSRSDAEREIAESTALLAELRQSAASAQQQLADRRADLAQLAERRANADAMSARLAFEDRELSERRGALARQLEDVAREEREISLQTAEHQRQVESLRNEKVRLEGRKTELESEWESSRVRSTEIEDTLRMDRQKLGDLREERSRHEVERARNDAEREHLRQSCAEELNLQPEDLIASESALLSGDDLRAADAQYHELKARIESMGPVNMMALEEYNECDQRFAFLSRERDDLMQSITDTQQAITELDQVCRQKFEEAFAFINQHFATAFHTLFGGGTGEMRLSEPDSAGEAGIDIVAQPPGKRLQNVLLLSGGEKALTALALLIAVFRYQPSPFCILDEVDAPLDEANVGRFTQMVHAMSEGTQFIVVTHNRRTMEMASVLYGVTMQEPGVSKLVSVRWDEARESQAAAAATNAA